MVSGKVKKTSGKPKRKENRIDKHSGGLFEVFVNNEYICSCKVKKDAETLLKKLTDNSK